MGVDDVASTAMLSISNRSKSKMLVACTDPKKEPHDTIPKLSASKQLGSEENVAEWKERVQKLEDELRAFQEKHDQRIADKNDQLQQQQEVLDEKRTEVSGLQEQQKAMQNLIDTLNKENGQLKQQTREENGSHHYHYHHQHRSPGAPRGSNKARGTAYASSRPDSMAPSRPLHTQSLSENRCPVCQVRFPRTTNRVIDIESPCEVHTYYDA